MDSERKKKRFLKVYSHAQVFSMKSLVLCFCFFVLYMFVSLDWFSFRATSVGSVFGVSSLPLLSSSYSNSVLDSFSFYGKLPIRIEARVLFPDHLLLLVSSGVQRRDNLECVYHRNLTEFSKDGEMMDEVLVQPVISIEEYDGYRSVVRCLLPPRNYSTAVSLRRIGFVSGGDSRLRSNQAAHAWDSVAYSAVLDGDTVVVFVKGLSLRPGRESDATHFTCRFGLSNVESNESFVLTTEAITAAQEVVRCKLPRSIMMNPDKAQGISVTVDHFYTSRGLPVHFTVPSVAKIYGSELELSDRKPNKKKYELCACTMVWNQAASLREWVAYHSWLGVERWFIYDNNSDDGTDKVIEELESENFKVSRQNWPWIKTQEAGFSHCALRANNECNWVGYFDVDEFYYFPYPTPQHPGIGIPGQNTLRQLVANYSDSTTVGEIRTDCHSFGPSGLRSIPAQGVTVGYTCRLKQPERHKSIIRPDALDPSLLNVVHHFRLKERFTSLTLPQNIAVVNHYKYQVWESFRAKFYRRVATYVVDWQENQNEGSKDRAPGLGTEAIEPPNWPQQFCEVWDTGLRDFVLANLADHASGSLPWDKYLM